MDATEDTGMDEANDLVRRLALLRPDLAVVPRTMTPMMAELAETAYAARRATVDVRDGDLVPAAIQAAWSRAVKHHEREGPSPQVLVDHNSMLASGFLARLVLESYPEDKVVFRTMNNDTYTGAEMAAQIEGNTEVGHAYASGIMRVCRDLLARQARRDAEAEPAPARGP